MPDKITTCYHSELARLSPVRVKVCSDVMKSKYKGKPDYVTLEVSSFQLETIQYFRPVVAVLLNVAPDHLDRYASMAEYRRAKARLFMN